MNFGIYEGSRMKNHLQEIDNRRFNTYDWSDVGGENQMMLKQKVQKTYQQIYEEAHDGDKILIVSHGAIFLHMMDFLFGLNIKKYIELIKNDPAEYLPIPNGYAAHFIRSNDKYDIIKLTRRDDSILKILKERK
jgi:broad specificity phosphatase PhoE